MTDYDFTNLTMEEAEKIMCYGSMHVRTKFIVALTLLQFKDREVVIPVKHVYPKLKGLYKNKRKLQDILAKIYNSSSPIAQERIRMTTRNRKSSRPRFFRVYLKRIGFKDGIGRNYHKEVMHLTLTRSGKKQLESGKADFYYNTIRNSPRLWKMVLEGK